MIAGALVSAGCATRPLATADPPSPTPIRSNSPGAPAPESDRGGEGAAPIYRNPKIARVILRAHEDAEGRLLGPQVMYQVAEPGGWNIQAAESGRGVIPEANAERPPNLNASTILGPDAAVSAPDSPLLDPERAGRITITGLMREDDRGAAEARGREAGEGMAAVFDRDAGWLLIPIR